MMCNFYLDGDKAQIKFMHDAEAWGSLSVEVKRRLHEGEKPKVALGTSTCVFWNIDDKYVFKILHVLNSQKTKPFR